MRARSQWGLVAVAAAAWMVSGCPSTPEPVLDGGSPLDAPTLDAPTLDAPPPDAGGEPRDGGPDTAVGDAPLPGDGRAVIEAAIAMACDSFAYGSCTVVATCACPLSSPTPPDELAACMGSFRASCASSVRSYLTDARALAGTVDEDAVARCIAMRRAAHDHCLPPVADSSELPLPCTQAITLAIPLGGACSYGGFFCAGGDGWCDGDLCSPIPSTEGAPCDPVCGHGLACVSGQCAPPSPTGGGCANNGDCETDLCIGNVCGTPLEVGAPCTETELCATGATCIDGRCARADVACSIVDEPSTCGARASCAGDVRRWCRPLLAEGGSCVRDLECMAPLTCDFRLAVPGTCGPRAELGESCARRGCVDGLRCLTRTDEGTMTCEVPLPLGASCAHMLEGTTGLMCDGGACVDGVCRPRPEAGEPCGDGIYELCAPGLFCLREIGIRMCTPLRAIREPCFEDRYCTPDTYCEAGYGCLPRVPLAGSCDCGPTGCPSCFAGLLCVGATGASRCVEPPRVGERCHDVCGPGSYCHVPRGEGFCRAHACDTEP